MNLRSVYVGSVKAARRLPGLESGLGRMERSDRRSVRHLRSLFAIHDTEDLVHLDVPWWTYAAIDRVEQFLAERPRRVFEFGAGASTVWLAKRAAEVVSVEHDRGYADYLTPLLAGFDNVKLHVVPPTPATGLPHIPSGRRGFEGLDFSDYVDTRRREGGIFDFVVVDGRARLACLDASLDGLADDGMLLFDDIRRRRYQPVLGRPDLDVQVHAGAKPSLPYPDSTALIRRRST